MFDPETWEEERQFPDQGYRSMMIDVPGHTGFWIGD